MPDTNNGETAPAATGTASEPKNPTVEAKPQESGQSVGIVAAPDKPDVPVAKRPHREPHRTLTPEERNAWLENAMAQMERERPLREAAAFFSADDKPMLSQKGRHPTRFNLDLSYWEWVARHDLRVSPWLADWEDSLERAGWLVIRKLSQKNVYELPNDRSFAQPQDADLYCPKRDLYLTLLPSKIPLAGGVIGNLEAMRERDRSSVVIMHARKRSKHFYEPRDNDFVRNLLSAKNTARCIELGAMVEFEGLLYEPDRETFDDGESEWLQSKNITAWEVYHEYRLHSLYYHKDQERADTSEKRHEATESYIRTLRERIQELTAPAVQTNHD